MMKPILVILRGNSGSGKTTIAKQIQKNFGPETMLVSQDAIRRDILHTRDKDNNSSIELIERIALYGMERCPIVILEGILIKERYGKMILNLIDAFNGNALVYYFDLSLEETFKRHRTKGDDLEFTEQDLMKWYRAEDWLGVNNESILTCELSKEEIERNIITDIQEIYLKP
ncbi:MULTISPECIES: AAA family ATPase [unclassified Exiguobacterium]|uniref:AAA family ATPase n=1 Tax=unclassified Exiguobacterium TaxID=2644629 RepID=UPI002552B5A3|nr:MULTISPECIES: AAA family ATPase [unclassified Exiguobacterium]